MYLIKDLKNLMKKVSDISVLFPKMALNLVSP